MITSMFFGDLDFLFYDVGMNLSPADTRNKMIGSWKELQTRAQTIEEYEELKKSSAFIKGAAIVTGNVWRGNNVGYFLNAIDLDNEIAIKEFCSCFRQDMTLEELAKITLVEQHSDDLTKAHIYVFSKHPFKDKESDSGKSWFNKETMPAIEVKCLKRIMYCTPSIHQNGSRYKFLDKIIPSVSEKLEGKINDALGKFDIEYLSDSDLRIRGVQQNNDAARTINQGSRHVELLREMNAKLHDFIRTKQLDDIKKMCISFNNLYCNPPLESTEFERMWQDSVTHVIKQESSSESTDIQTQELSVAEAIRMNAGKVIVKGMIIGLSSVIQVVKETEFGCDNCGHSDIVVHDPPLFSITGSFSNNNRKQRCVQCDAPGSYGPRHHKEQSAMKIQLQDEEKHNDLESLTVVLFDKDTIDVRNGEKVMIYGDLHVVQKQSGGNGARVTYLFANSIEYKTSPKDASIEITEDDLVKLGEFVAQPNMTNELTKLFAPNVIGHEEKKLAVILMYIGSPETEDFRGRIHGLFIGPPGIAKTKLAWQAKKLGEPQSRYSSCQGASAKSITAIIDKDNDSYVLRLGVLPQAKNWLCVLNEIASLTMEDQRHLFDSMEEGFLTIDKYGFHREIEAQTTVLGTTNPESGEWYLDIAEKGRIPLRKELADRFDLIMVFKPLKDKERKIEYATKKIEILEDQSLNENSYAFLRKIIEHAKTFNPRLTEEAKSMIVNYWSNLNNLVFPTNRVLETILRVTKAFARLHFSEEITPEIASEAICFLTKIYQDFDSTVQIVKDPRDVACHAITEFLQSSPNIPYDFADCINYASDSDSLVQSYLGRSPIDPNSSKYRDIADRFKQGLAGGGLVTIVNMKPLTLVFNVQVKEKQQ